MDNNFRIIKKKFKHYYENNQYSQCAKIIGKLSKTEKNQYAGDNTYWVYDIVKQMIIDVTIDKIDAEPNRYFEINYETLSKLSTENTDNIIKAIKSNGEDKFYNVGINPIDYVRDDYMNKESWLGSNLYHNPYGLWFGCGSEWQRFINKPSQWSLSTHLYEIELNPSVKRISSVKELSKFIDQYKNSNSQITFTNVLDWERIKEDYDGMVICPYLGYEIWGEKANEFKIVGNPESIDNYVEKLAGDTWKSNIFFTAEWYRHWETGSGVVWRASGVKDFRLVEHMKTFDNLIKFSED